MSSLKASARRADLGSFETRLARRVPLVKPLLVAIPDALRAMRFRINRSHRAARLAVFRNCRSPVQLLGFSNATFGTGQIPEEILGFLGFAAEQAPESVCEIGTATGGTTFLIGQALPTCSLVVGVDLYVKNRYLLRLFCRPGQRLQFISGSSASPRTLGRVRRAVGRSGLDLLFIDGDHSYEGVKQDFLAYGPFVRDGGIIALHDICQGSGSAGMEGTGAWTGGVPRFWSEVKELYVHREFVRDREQFGFGIGAIRYDPTVSVLALSGSRSAARENRSPP